MRRAHALKAGIVAPQLLRDTTTTEGAFLASLFFWYYICTYIWSRPHRTKLSRPKNFSTTIFTMIIHTSTLSPHTRSPVHPTFYLPSVVGSPAKTRYASKSLRAAAMSPGARLLAAASRLVLKTAVSRSASRLMASGTSPLRSDAP